MGCELRRSENGTMGIQNLYRNRFQFKVLRFILRAFKEYQQVKKYKYGKENKDMVTSSTANNLQDAQQEENTFRIQFNKGEYNGFNLRSWFGQFSITRRC